ncbi:DUF4229 domain-containing protein [Streptomyces fuscigenes]|uniref:DUF4229 domain-containing protein n=1 Tax=Streptomyces fuscigenes TaxID=1528880 RepID=UPI001F17DAF3|nr:DUF4229 domain-containing protein [Streptomyces fuscigenes]MCF3962608.1 DUF4229 domain-containing protein [Streptomyces fuscigenes]
MARIAIFIGCLVVVAALTRVGVVPRGLGASNGIWVLLLALIISAPISFVVLRKQRDEMSVKVSGRVDRARARLEANRASEDVE